MTIDQLRADFEAHRERIAAMPDTGSVLFNMTTALAITLPDGDADKGRIAGLTFAHIFSDADRHHGGTPPAGLDRLYSDGAGRKFMLYDIKVAKRVAIERLDAALAALPMVGEG